ncbi:hypothetical protein DXG01_007400 [Tephrocybe rancida]|nr:hypothetical protein DXG01_007400 [Tephrocybe rancida]
MLWEDEDEEPCTLAEYRDWLRPDGLQARRQFDLEIIELWFLDALFKLFLSQKQSKPLAQSSALGKRQVVPEIITKRLQAGRIFFCIDSKEWD